MMFHRETEFQVTPIGKIPDEWDVVRLGEVGEVVSGFGFSLDYQGKKSGKYPFVKVGDMNLTDKYVTSAENYVDDEDLKALRAKAFPPNTLIFPKIGMATYLNKYRILKVWGTFDNNVAGVLPKKIDPEFLFYYFAGRVDLKQLSNRTTAPSIKKTVLESVLIPLPSIEEQRGIVGVLCVVDSVIAKTGEVIAKTERLKKGLMQTLLTRGIGHKEYKQTPIGTIPKEWEVVKLGDIAEVVSGFGFPLEYQGRKSGKYPFIKVGDMNSFEKYVTSADNFVEEEDVISLKARIFPPNTIIFPKIGMATYLNKFRILKTWGTFDNNVAGVIPKKCEPEFLFYYFLGKIDLKQLSSRTTAPSIRKTTLESLLIPLPPLSEQQKIAEVLCSIDVKLQFEKNEKTILERIKRGLMDLLLSGKVRVKVD